MNPQMLLQALMQAQQPQSQPQPLLPPGSPMDKIAGSIQDFQLQQRLVEQQKQKAQLASQLQSQQIQAQSKEQGNAADMRKMILQSMLRPTPDAATRI